MRHAASHLPSVCPFNLFKLVCIRAIPNNSRMLLHSKLVKIRLWKRKKQLNIDIFVFFTLQYDYSWFFLFAQMKWFILTQKKYSKIGICMWANTQRFQLRCFEKDMCFAFEWLKDVLCEREIIKMLSRPRSCSIVGSSSRVVTASSIGRTLVMQINGEMCKNAILLSTCQKLNCGLSLVSFFIRPFL